MNKEQTIEAIKVMQAFVDGKEVEQKNNHHLTNALPLWNPAPSPAWNWGDDIKNYRIKPTATLRPWTADEVPLGAWMRKKQAVPHRWVVIETGDELWRQDWCKNHEHSTDCGKTWLPCGVMEEAAK
jgi:hypothetical protein